MKVLLVLTALLAAATAGLIQLKNEINPLDVNGNDFVDKLLDQVKVYMTEHGLDPLSIPDYMEELTVLFIHVNFELTNGKMQGLPTIYRSGDAVMNYEDHVVKVNAQLGFNTLTINYDFKASIGDLNTKGNVIITIDDLNADINAQIDMLTSKAHLNSLTFSHTGSIHVKLDTDHEILNTVENAIVNSITKLFKDDIMSKAQDSIADAINKVLENM